MRRVELLAPAGDLLKLKIALHYGADAVYLGGTEYSLRARASNFTLQDIEKGVRFAHRSGRKVYVAVNAFFHPEDAKGLPGYLKKLEAIGVDALIVASSGAASLVGQHTSLPFHISTQQSTTNSEAVRFWEGRGAGRTILARELTMDELERLRKATDAELEVFIHGGMCASYSGRCTLSNHMTHRDANRGGCAHSCRWDYDLYAMNDKLDIETPFSLGSKDLCAVREVPRLIGMGIDALKIEGRMKSIHYIATVVNVYRRLIDAVLQDDPIDFAALEEEIAKAENRPTGQGFLKGSPSHTEQLYNLRSEPVNKVFLGIVKAYDEKREEAVIDVRNRFSAGDTLEILTPAGPSAPFRVESLFDEEGYPLQTARHPRERIRLKTPRKVEPYDLLRRV